MNVATWVLVLTLTHTHVRGAGAGLTVAPELYPTRDECRAAGLAFRDALRYAYSVCIPGPSRSECR